MRLSTFLQTVAQVVTPLKGHSQSPCGCPPSSKLWHKWLRHSRDTLSLRAAVHLPPNCGTSGYATQGTLSVSVRLSTFLQTVAQVVTPLKGHSQSPCGCPPSSKLWHKWLRHSRDTLSLRVAVHLPPNCGTSGYATQGTLSVSVQMSTFLQTVAQVVTPLKGHSQSPCGCPPSSKLWHKWLRHSRDTLSLRAAVHLPPNCGTSGYATQGTLSVSVRLSTFLQTVAQVVTPLKGHSQSPCSCPPTLSAPSEGLGTNKTLEATASKHARQHQVRSPRV